MDIAITDKEKSQKELTITVPADTWGKEMESVIAHFGAQMKVDGFRKGKIPKDVVMREIGKDAIVAEAAERAIKKAYARAIKEKDVKAIAQPTISIAKLAEGNDLVFTATVAVLPKITLAKDYKKKIAKENAKRAKEKVAVDDKRVEEAMEKIAQQYAENVHVDRPARKGDVAIIDFIVEVDGAVIDGGTGKNHPLVIGSGAFIPGFEDAIVGMVTGEKKTIKLTFPKDYHAKDLAGKEATFTITLNRVEERIVPEIDDAFAQKVHPQSKTVNDLKKHICQNLEAEEKNEKKQKHREALAEILAQNVEGDIPEQLVDNELARMEEQFTQQLAQSGAKLDDVLKQIGKTKEELLKEWRPQAQKRAKIGLALDYIAETENIAPDKKKVEEEMQKMLALYGGDEEAKKKVDLAHLHNYAKAMLQQEAVFDYLEGIKS